MGVSVGQRLQDLNQQVDDPGPGLRHHGRLCGGASPHELERQPGSPRERPVDGGIGAALIEDAHDVGMLQGRERTDLRLEALPSRRAVGVPKQLDGRGVARGGVHRPPDMADATAPDGLQQLERTDGRPH